MPQFPQLNVVLLLTTDHFIILIHSLGLQRVKIWSLAMAINTRKNCVWHPGFRSIVWMYHSDGTWFQVHGCNKTYGTHGKSWNPHNCPQHTASDSWCYMWWCHVSPAASNYIPNVAKQIHLLSLIIACVRLQSSESVSIDWRLTPLLSTREVVMFASRPWNEGSNFLNKKPLLRQLRTRTDYMRQGINSLRTRSI
jgi:hypothetical protein